MELWRSVVSNVSNNYEGTTYSEDLMIVMNFCNEVR